MKKLKGLLGLSLALILLLLALVPAVAASDKTALPTTAAVTVDGAPVAVGGYNIDGSNYFKLRDIAMALNGTARQFEVGYDPSGNAITLTPGAPYTPVGGELKGAGGAAARTATVSSAKITRNGSPVQLSAYLIGGNNYFKLRDLGSALNFGVTWNETANTIEINTAKGYISDESNIGFFDFDVDYTAKPNYKIVYMMSALGVLYDMMDNGFLLWAARLNCDYSSFSSMGDNELYIAALERYAKQGIDGFLLDPDTAIYPRLIEILDEYEIAWMPCMVQATDESGKLLHPCVGFDNTDFGVQMATWSINYAQKTWPNAKASEIGMLSMDFSLSPQVHERTTGAQGIWRKQGFPENNFVVVDGATVGDFTEDGGFNLARPAFAARPDIKYWLVCAFMDDYASGAALAAKELGLEDNCVVIDCGGSELIGQWDGGVETSWKAAVYAAQMLFVEPMICGLYAMMDGQATPETLWPDFINKAAGEKYAFMKVPTYILTKDNYTEYLEWVDWYTGFDMSSYTYNGTRYPARAPAPSF